MEKVEKVEQKVVTPKKVVKYYRNARHAGESFITKMDDLDPTMIDRISFKPVREKYQGDTVQVGYLATDEKSVQERCDSISYIESITKAEFEQATSKPAKKGK